MESVPYVCDLAASRELVILAGVRDGKSWTRKATRYGNPYVIESTRISGVKNCKKQKIRSKHVEFCNFLSFAENGVFWTNFRGIKRKLSRFGMCKMRVKARLLRTIWGWGGRWDAKAVFSFSLWPSLTNFFVERFQGYLLRRHLAQMGANIQPWIASSACSRLRSFARQWRFVCLSLAYFWFRAVCWTLVFVIFLVSGGLLDARFRYLFVLEAFLCV